MAKKILLIIFCLGLITVAAAGALYYSLTRNAVAATETIYVDTDTDYAALVKELDARRIIKSARKFDLAARLLKLDKGIRPGHYVIKQGTDYLTLAKIFKRGLQSPVRVTFNNMRTLPLLAGRISQQLRPDSASLAYFLTSPSTAADYGFESGTFISMFIPDTYEMYWTTTPERFTERMNEEYERFWSGKRDEKLEKLGLSRIEVSTLASIVYEETKMNDEMAVVAGVYVNRLRRGMRLQADPTVKFAVGDPSLRRILLRHLEVDSPYNTYLHEGLPPGPISMPSVQAIDAVLDYAHHDYLYFCARPDFSGYHNFASTLAGHNRNRDAWIRALNQAGIR